MYLVIKLTNKLTTFYQTCSQNSFNVMNQQYELRVCCFTATEIEQSKCVKLIQRCKDNNYHIGSCEKIKPLLLFIYL